LFLVQQPCLLLPKVSVLGLGRLLVQHPCLLLPKVPVLGLGRLRLRSGEAKVRQTLLYCMLICRSLIDIYSCNLHHSDGLLCVADVHVLDSRSERSHLSAQRLIGRVAVLRPTKCLQFLSKHLLGWVAGRASSDVGVAHVYLDVDCTIDWSNSLFKTNTTWLTFPSCSSSLTTFQSLVGGCIPTTCRGCPPVP